MLSGPFPRGQNRNQGANARIASRFRIMNGNTARSSYPPSNPHRVYASSKSNGGSASTTWQPAARALDDRLDGRRSLRPDWEAGDGSGDGHPRVARRRGRDARVGFRCQDRQQQSQVVRRACHRAEYGGAGSERPAIGTDVAGRDQPHRGSQSPDAAAVGGVADRAGHIAADFEWGKPGLQRRRSPRWRTRPACWPGRVD